MKIVYPSYRKLGNPYTLNGKPQKDIDDDLPWVFSDLAWVAFNRPIFIMRFRNSERIEIARDLVIK